MSGHLRFGRRHALAVGGLAFGAGAVALSRRTAPATIESAAGAATPEVRTPADLPHLAGGGAPSVQGGSGWLNTAGVGDAELASRVVLYEFWTFGCINCRHVLGHTTAWYERYASDGLELLSIHTPEFDYEREPDAVAEFVEAHSISYPVALDPDKVIWHRWQNHYWPAFYLYDTAGSLRHRQYGEGRYDDTEDAIRALLGVATESPRAVVTA